MVADRPQAALGTPATAGAPARRRRRTLITLVAALAAVVVGAGFGVAYLAGGFADEGRFRAEPDACATLAPSLHLLGRPYVAHRTGSNNCELWLPRDQPGYVAAPKITVAYGVSRPERGNAPEAAGRTLSSIAAVSQRLPGIGDEAYRRDRDVFFRVSNLVVGIIVLPNPVSSPEEVQAFTADLAKRLQS